MDDETFARFTGILSRIDSDPFNQTRIPVDIDGRDKSSKCHDVYIKQFASLFEQ